MTNSIVKTLFATHATQGQRTNDFCWTPEGELVTFSIECDGEEIDGTCGCRRSMKGLQSLKLTTTVTVGSLRGGKAALLKELRQHFERYEWGRRFDEQEMQQIIETEADELMKIASSFPVRTVLEIRGNQVQSREKH